MNEKEINMAIAKFFGWDSEKLKLLYSHGLDPSVPDYCNDLNAMHEVEQKMGADMWWRYLDQLVADDRIRATALERAIAFLKSIGKYQEIK